MNILRQITQEEIDNNPAITMIEEGNENLLSNTKIKINTVSLIRSRNLKDGISIIGNNVKIALKKYFIRASHRWNHRIS